MDDDYEHLVKVRLPTSVGSYGAETVWARPLERGLYEVRNIPWLRDDINFLDVIRCRQDDPFPVFIEVAERSGHRTLYVVFRPSASDRFRSEALQELNRLVGNVEKATSDAWLIDVNPKGDYDAVIRYLDNLRASGYVE